MSFIGNIDVDILEFVVVSEDEINLQNFFSRLRGVTTVETWAVNHRSVEIEMRKFVLKFEYFYLRPQDPSSKVVNIEVA